MENLQQKAHTSLQEFKSGRMSPVASLSLPSSTLKQLLQSTNGQSPLYSPGSPDTPATGSSEDGGDDELAKLGGRTRLIKEHRDKDLKNGVYVKENSASPTLSPLRGYGSFGAFPGQSQNGTASFGPHGIGQPQGAVVPLPLSLHDGSGAAAVHPSVVDYLSSFVHPGAPGAQVQVQNRHTSEQMAYNGGYAHSSGYESGSSNAGTGALPTPTSPDSTLVLPSPASSGHHQYHSHSHSHIASHQQSQSQGQANGQSQQYFPQYFPVFDYSASAAPSSAGYGAHGSGTAAYDQDTAMAYEPEHPHAHAQHNLNGGGMNGLTSYGRREITPEGGGASMHNTWMDFVSQMSMQ